MNFAHRLLKFFFISVVLSSAAPAFVTSSQAFSQVAIPALTSPVIDQVRVLSDQENQTLAAQLSDSYARGGPQQQVWITPSLQGEDVAALAYRAVSTWQLGRNGKDDGVLILLATEDRRSRIEVGRGVEGAVPDIVAGRLLRDILRPALRSAKVFEGLTAVTLAIAKIAGGENPNQVLPKQSNQDIGSLSTNAQLILLCAMVALFVILSRMKRSAALGAIAGMGLPRTSGWGGSIGGGGRSSGGGWSGGGGGFGGGGSSGDW